MMCISLWQPWATLMVMGAKLNETRSWPTSHRGPLAIHAAKKWNRELESLCFQEPFARTLSKLRPNEGGMFHLEDILAKVLPFGAIVGVVNVIRCLRIDTFSVIEPDERAFGDYTPGRFMWQTTSARQLKTPVPYRGAQGLFTIPDSLLSL